MITITELVRQYNSGVSPEKRLGVSDIERLRQYHLAVLNNPDGTSRRGFENLPPELLGQIRYGEEILDNLKDGGEDWETSFD